MFQRGVLVSVLFFLSVVFCFGQASALREYVGLIKVNYHSDVIALMNKYKNDLEKMGYTRDARAIDVYLQGIRGTGFVYVAPDGTNYILTNEHVISQAETVSITFEKLDGARTTYDNLKILQIDEEKDIAILAFDGGVKPFPRGLSFNTTAVDEGTAVFAAGFPSLGTTAAWQYSQGIISNAAVRLPKSFDTDELFGPFIQHSAQIDPGNSGGPLLVARQGVPTNHAVIGINTLSVRWRQAANYAVPIDQVSTFITSALSDQPVNDMELITKKTGELVKGLSANRAVYDHISLFLSSSCIAMNAEDAIIEVTKKAPRNVIQDIATTFNRSPVDGMKYAVAWYIENAMRTRSGAIRASVESIEPNLKGGYTVTFNINGTTVQSDWKKEYGVFRMDTYGDVATSDRSVISSRQKTREQNDALRTDYSFAVYAGYTNIMKDIGHAFTASVFIADFLSIGLDLTHALGDTNYTNISFDVGLLIPVRMGSVAVMPFGNLGGGIILRDKTDKFGDFGFDMNLCLQGGLMFTTVAVPGLFLRAFYSHNIIFMGDVFPSHGFFSVGIGYGF
jgi:serine protease Do